jgi:hypothetical protein
VVIGVHTRPPVVGRNRRAEPFITHRFRYGKNAHSQGEVMGLTGCPRCHRCGAAGSRSYDRYAIDGSESAELTEPETSAPSVVRPRVGNRNRRRPTRGLIEPPDFGIMVVVAA